MRKTYAVVAGRLLHNLNPSLKFDDVIATRIVEQLAILRASDDMPRAFAKTLIKKLKVAKVCFRYRSTDYDFSESIRLTITSLREHAV